MTSIDSNWIETKVEGPCRASWRVVRDGRVIHTDEWHGHDPSGFQAYRLGTKWVEAHCPGISFHWRHRAYSRVVRAPQVLAQDEVAAPMRLRRAG